MLYLDHAATGGSKPSQVQNAVLAAMKSCANPGRSGHALSLAVAERVFECRELLSDLFSGYGGERVIFTKNCTEALNLALLGTLSKGDHVVTSCLEHNSVLRPLAFLRQAGIIDYSVAPLDGGKLRPERIAALVRKNTVLCAVTAASNVTGETPDLAALRAMLPERVFLVADGAQAAGHFPVRMRETGIDALALAGHKGLDGIQGAGALLFSERFSPRPLLFGGTGSESRSLHMPEFYPDRLESGTLSYPAVCSLYEGALLAREELPRRAASLLARTASLNARLSALPAYRVFSAPNPVGIFSFAHETLSSEEIADALSERFQIAVRGGLHCAPLAHKALGSFPQGLVRASFSPCQGKKEEDALIEALSALA